MDWIRKQLDAGRAERVVAALKRHRRFEAVAACIRYYEANMDRMRYDLYRRRGLPVGSGIVESACKRIVGSRLKAGRHCESDHQRRLDQCCIENRLGPTCSIAGLPPRQPPNQRIWSYIFAHQFCDPRTLRRRSSSMCASHEFPNLILPTSEWHARGGNFGKNWPHRSRRFDSAINRERCAEARAGWNFSLISEDAKGFFYVTIVNLGFLFDESER